MASQAMRTLRAFGAALLLATAGVPPAHARIEQPDHVFYGNARLFGNAVAPGTPIEARSVPGGELIARYVYGRDPRLGGQYALSIPMDSVDPRTPGRARAGDPVRLYIGAQLAAETSVGEEGVAVRLDLDPQNSGTGPALVIADAERAEGHDGSSSLAFLVSLNTTSTETVVLGWETEDGTATGGVACGPGIDYVTELGQNASIAPGALTTQLEVLVCGDTTIEPHETFSVDATSLTHAVLADPTAIGTIRDDDNVPVLDVADARALEPQAGTVQMLFHPRLSRAAPDDVSVAWSTASGSALAGADFVAASGVATIPAGELQTQLAVTLLADAQVEADETLFLQLSAPVSATLARSQAMGTVVDPAFDPAVQPIGAVSDQSVPSLVQPSALAVSADGRHVYATSDSLDSVLLFTRGEGAGALTFVQAYSAATAGFSAALLDGADDIVLSADGAFAYVAARNSDAIAVFSRNASSGQLGFVGNIVNGQNGVQGLDGVVALALAPGGTHLYAAARSSHAVAAFVRDAGSGQLAYLQALVGDAAAGGSVVAMDQPNALLVSPDGAHVYVASRFGDAVQVLNRNTDPQHAAFGHLTSASVVRDGLLGIEGLGGASALSISADGQHLYVVGESDDSLVLFDRAGDGSLVQRQRWQRGTAGIPGMDGPVAIALTADGEELYVASFADSSLTVFRRLLAAEGALGAGALVPRQTLYDDQGATTELGGPSAVVTSPDSRNAYVAASTDNAIVVLLRQAYLGIFGDGFDD